MPPNRSVNHNPFCRSDDTRLSCLCTNACPTKGVMPIRAPIENTMNVKNTPLAKLTAARSVVL